MFCLTEADSQKHLDIYGWRDETQLRWSCTCGDESANPSMAPFQDSERSFAAKSWSDLGKGFRETAYVMLRSDIIFFLRDEPRSLQILEKSRRKKKLKAMQSAVANNIARQALGIEGR